MEVATLSNIPQSMADYLETEKIYKELCKNITEGVTTQDMNSSTDKAVTPDDEITALLKQMNQILTPDENESILDSSEERSVDVILKEAEDLIRSSTPLFLNMSSSSSTKTTSASKIKLTSPLNVTQTISKIQEIHPDNPNNEQLKQSSKQLENKESDVIESDDSRNLSKSFQSKSSGLSNYSMSEANDMIFKNIVNKKKRKSSDNMKSKNNMAKEKSRDRLSISDLAIPIIKEVKTVSIEEQNKNKFKNKKDKLIDEDVDQSLIGVGELDSSHEEQTINLKKQINILYAKLKEYESSTKDMKSEAQNLVTAQQKQLEMLEAELHSQEQLIAGYQRENHKLCQDMNAAKEQWKQKENKMLEEKQTLQREVHGMMSASVCESLKEQLKDAQETIVKLQLELATSKCTTKELELKCDRLQGDIILLESEVENYRGQIEEFNTRDNKAASTAALATTNALSAQLSNARDVIARKDAEIVRLNTSLGTLRAELNKKHTSNQSNQIYEVESLNVTISQLQAALSLERDHSKELNREKDSLVRETLDLRRQV
uniref:Uncharacterized protein n=2 Tax=Clastoptera arizonana TaxID=38151 RepID=A0A1B6CMF6_9HEMI